MPISSTASPRRSRMWTIICQSKVGPTRYQHSKPTTFAYVDGWVRMRLRSILRWRSGDKGRGRGRDHQKWTNQWFAKQGLFTLEAAHEWTLTILKYRTH